MLCRLLRASRFAHSAAATSGLFLLVSLANVARADRIEDGTGVVVITEVQYHPLGGGRDLEFIELHNATPAPIDISGWFFSNGVAFEFPSRTWIDGGDYLVVCANAERIREVYGIENAIGDWGANCQSNDSSGCSLDNGGETIELAERSGIVHARLEYNDRGDWPSAADGTGHSLEITDPHRPQNDSDSWLASGALGGSPGKPNTALERLTEDPDIRINEALLLTSGERWIELFNATADEVDVSGYRVTIDRGDLQGVSLPAETKIAARGWLRLGEAELGLDLTPPLDGESGEPRLFVALVRADGERVIDAYEFRPEVDEMSEARFPDGDEDFSDRAVPTPGAANEVDVETNIVIHEVMYHPIDNDPRNEWIELYNRGDAPVDLTGWSITRGVDFDFPDGTTIAAGGYLVVARDAAHIREVYGLSDNAVIGPDPADEDALADYGNLRDSGERILLRDANGNVADTVRYHDGGQWPDWCDGKGSSLELVDPWQDNNSPLAWDASDDSHKAEVVEHSYVGRLSGNEPELRLFLQGRGIVLVDDLRMVRREVNLRVDSVLLDDGPGWKYFKGVEEASNPREAWRQPEFDDGAWLDGATPIGFGEDGIVTELADMEDNYISVFMRRTFQVTDVEALREKTLVLQAVFDDGFIVYLNGVAITDPTEGNMRDGEDTFDSRARSSVETREAEIELDETDKARFVEGENTIAVQFHNSTIGSSDSYFSLRLIEGEFVEEDSENLVQGGDFEEDFDLNRATPGAWFIEGTHVNSGRTTVDPISGSGSMKIVAGGRGDNKVNRIETTLPALSPRIDYAISFKSRWVVGAQTLITQGHDQSFPHSHTLGVPLNLGTPGAPNSSARANAGPVIDKFEQDPPLPGNEEDTEIAVRVSDPDGVASVKLYWAANRPVFDDEATVIEMEGPDARGRYRAVVPGQRTRTMVVAWIVAEDTMGQVGRYPTDQRYRTHPKVLDPENPDLIDGSYIVYRHDTEARTTHQSYRFWLHQLNEVELTRRRLHSNLRLEGTFLFDNHDIYQHASTRFSGSPWARGGWAESMRVGLPKDAPLHGGIRKFNMEDHQGAGGRDAKERISHYLISNMQGTTKAPYAFQWVVQWQANDRVNDVREHVEAPNTTTIKRWWPDGDEGDFFEMDDRHVFTDGGGRQNSIDGRMDYPPYPNQAVILNLPKDSKELYRWYFNPRLNEQADDFTNLIELAKVLDPTNTPNEDFDRKIWDMIDVEAFLRVWSIRMNTDDWDTWGTDRGKNCYLYRPNDTGKWALLPWDMELTYGNVGAFMPPPITTDYRSIDAATFPEVVRLINRPRIKRLYYGIMKELVDGPFNSQFLEPYMAKLRARGLSSTQVGSPNGFVDQRNRSLQNILRSATLPAVELEIRTNGGDPFTADTPVVHLEGRAPVEIVNIVAMVDGAEPTKPVEVHFSDRDPLGFEADVPLGNGAHQVMMLGFGHEGDVLGSDSIQITVEASAPVIESVTPDVVMRGDMVTIRATGLHAGTEVWFDDILASEVDRAGLPESISAVVPPSVGPGAVAVVIGIEGLRSAPVSIEVNVPAGIFLRGDADQDDAITIGDPVTVLFHLFRGSPLGCDDAADANDDGSIDLTDPIYLLDFLFRRGSEPALPFPSAGSDPTNDDVLDCASGGA